MLNAILIALLAVPIVGVIVGALLIVLTNITRIDNK
jgi:hypothetical protein